MSSSPTDSTPHLSITVDTKTHNIPTEPSSPKTRSRSSSTRSSNPGLSSPSGSPLSPTMSLLQTPPSFTGSTFTRPAIQPPSPPTTTSTLSYFLPSSTTAVSPAKKPVSASPTVYPWVGPSPTSSPASPLSPSGASGLTLTRILSNPTSAQNESAIEDDDDTPGPGNRSLLFRPTTHAGTGTGTGTGGGRANSPPHSRAGHFRTGSLNLGVWGPGPSGNNAATTGSGHQHNAAARERAAGVMRRLSLSGALGGNAKPAIFPPERSRIPSPPMNTPVTPQSSSAQQTLMSAPPSAYPSGGGGSLLGLAGLNGGRENKAQNGQGQEKTRGRPRGMSESIKKRGISPMGERMIKGHFDGFGV